MKKRMTSLFLFVGLVLVLVSVCIALVFGIRTRKGAEKGQLVAAQLAEILPERTPGVPGMFPDMPIWENNGADYVALLEIPAYGVRLPVADRWESRKLWVCPARFWGNVYDNSLIIGGNDADGQFSFCDKIENGAMVTITDMTGAAFTYTVSQVDRAKHAQLQWLTEGDYDLTLFCQDVFAMEYIAVRCNVASR